VAAGRESDVGATSSPRLKNALRLPSGARFYRCALQVNPFAYLRRHNKLTAFKDEESYNKAVIAACQSAAIEVIGVTDHYRVEESVGLVTAARAAGLYVFGGFEAVSKDGVHFLCLFDQDKEASLERLIGECGVRDASEASPTGDLDSEELPTRAKEWGAACIAAHALADAGGLLKKLSGQTRVKTWTNPHLLACAIAGPVDQAPENVRPILKNEDAAHRRASPCAVINASDVNDPADLQKPGASCFIKMSAVSVEGLRQAFLDPQSRIRLNSDSASEPHAEFIAMTWEGGFLNDTAVHFNENLNVLVGGRGTGKSTLIESLRYVLGIDPLGEDARKSHEGVIRHVLRAGTKVSLLVRSHTPSQRCYTIERSVPNPPTVKDEAGEVLTLSPRDVMPGVEVFGQHEISELTKSREKLALLLERFVDRDSDLSSRKAKLRLELERSRSRLLDIRRETKALDDRLATLPGLEETQKRFQDAGLEEKLKERTLLIREERVFTNVAERLEVVRALQAEVEEALPLDTAFVTPKALEGLPGADLLGQLQRILDELSGKVQAASTQMLASLSDAEKAIDATKGKWSARRKAIVETYEKLLRELQKSKIDGNEFIRLRQQIEELRPLREKKDALARELATHEARRRKLLTEWEDTKASEYRELESAAKKVSRKLRERVRVEVAMAGNREPLEQLLREVGGNLAAAIERLRSADHLSLPEFAQRCREGKDALVKHFGLPAGSAERIAQAAPDLFMRIEELDLPATAAIELNTAPESEPPTWQTLEQLSTGQKATAVLLLLLLESEAPLVVDQPEDDLDNRFITEGVVPIMRQEKRRRQFVFSTHNANIPVLGDAELILGLAASGEAKEGRAKIEPEHMASIDAKPVRDLVEEILEGGREAFEMRRSKYGF
jgi:predicted ATPase